MKEISSENFQSSYCIFVGAYNEKVTNYPRSLTLRLEALESHLWMISSALLFLIIINSET
jgi:hypothetical protein